MKRTNAVHAVAAKPTLAGLEIDPALYERALAFLFTTASEPGAALFDWSSVDDELGLRDVDWVRVQTMLYAHAGEHLRPYSDAQVAVGLSYLYNNAITDVPFALDAADVSLDLQLQLLLWLPTLWHDCIGPRLAACGDAALQPRTRLGHVGHMWFDVWPAPYCHREIQEWQRAMEAVFESLIGSPNRSVHVAGLHGIGHCIRYLDGQRLRVAIDALVARIDSADERLLAYAKDAADGMVL